MSGLARPSQSSPFTEPAHVLYCVEPEVPPCREGAQQAIPSSAGGPESQAAEHSSREPKPSALSVDCKIRVSGWIIFRIRWY